MIKILCIEDNLDVRELMADLLELQNYQVATAENGKIGVEKARQFQPDVIVCDIMMPQMDGYEVLQTLSEDPKMGCIPFIFLTAKSEMTDLRKGMDMGADDYLVKPFEDHELLNAIESRLKKNDFLRKEFSRNLSGINEFLEEASQYMDMESLSRDYHLINYKKKEILFREGNSSQKMYFIQSGNIKTFKTMELGKEFVTGFYGPGDFVGQLSFFNEKGIYTETAMVLEDVEICEIPKRDFVKLLYGNKVVSSKFISMISNDLSDLQEKLANMAFASVRQRMAKTLLELYDKGVINDDLESGIGISREDLAGLMGTATETAIRMLYQFKDEGLIGICKLRKLRVLDRAKLQQVADFS